MKEGQRYAFVINNRGVVLEVHHIKPRRAGGNDTVANLITLCRKCHEYVTGRECLYEEYFYGLIDGYNVSLKPAMHIMQGKTYLYKSLMSIVGEDNVYLCTGGDTANNRIDWEIEKTHSNDAVCITHIKCSNDNVISYDYIIKCKRKKKQTNQDTSGFAIKHGDIVWYKPRGRNKVKCYVVGILKSGKYAGSYAIKAIVDGERFSPISVKSLQRVTNKYKNLLIS